MAVMVSLLKLPAGRGNPVGKVRSGPVLAGHGAGVLELDDDVPASPPDRNGQIWRGRSCGLPQGVGDELIRGPLDAFRKPLSRQLNDRDRALRMLCRAAHGAGQPLNGQSRGADSVRQVPQIRERPLGGKVGIGQPGRKSGLGPACRARPGQAERITQCYQALLRAVVQIAFQARPRGIGSVDHELPSRAEVVDPRQCPGLDALGVKEKPRRRDRPGHRCVVDPRRAAMNQRGHDLTCVGNHGHVPRRQYDHLATMVAPGSTRRWIRHNQGRVIKRGRERVDGAADRIIRQGHRGLSHDALGTGRA